MVEDRVPWAEYRQYRAQVRAERRPAFQQHLRDQVLVSGVIALATGTVVFFTTSVGFWPSVGYGGIVLLVWMLGAGFFYDSRAHVIVYRDAANDRDSFRSDAQQFRAEIVERDTARFDAVAFDPERLDDYKGRSGSGGQQIRFSRRTVLYIAVQNRSGRAARFSAAYSNVRPIKLYATSEVLEPHHHGHGLAWEDSTTRTNEVGYHGAERLLAVECFREPFAFWFLLPQTAAWGEEGRHAASPPVCPIGDAVQFDVQIVNQTEGQEIWKLATITFAEDHTVADFTLVDL